jgi:hypothetical protein
MAITLPGAEVRLYINNTVFAVTQSVEYTYEPGSYSIYGIDSPYPQELASGGQVSMKGSINGLRLKNGGGPQAQSLIPLFFNIVASPYIPIRLEDRSTGEVIFSGINCKITNIKDSVSTKGIYKVSFGFECQIPYFPLDLS